VWGLNLAWEYLESAGPQRHGSETTCLAGLSQGPIGLPASWVVHWLASPILMRRPSWCGDSTLHESTLSPQALRGIGLRQHVWQDSPRDPWDYRLVG
jgi:hypothetical protein